MRVSVELRQRRALGGGLPVLVQRTGYWLLCATIGRAPYCALYRRAA